jgi:predicted transcriptional regulator
VILTLDGEFENYFVSFSPLEREVLVALGTGSIQPSEVAREVRKPIFNISKTLTTLINYGIIERPMKGQYRLADPVFADWLSRRFKKATTFTLKVEAVDEKGSQLNVPFKIEQNDP